MRRPRWGIFGGTFDPPHLGHLVIAEWAREQLGLDRVIFVPVGAPPHKRRHLTPASTRVAMTQLAVHGNPAFAVSTIEARRRGVSFTVDTLRALRRETPDARLYLVVGEDSLREFHTWREPEEILALAELAVAPRADVAPVAARGRSRPSPTRANLAGHAAGAGRASSPRVIWLDSPHVAISSSAIRTRASRGASVRYLVPDPVAEYLARRRVYGKA